MNTGLRSRFACHAACVLMLASAPAVMAQAAGTCSEIANDVRLAVEKDPSKVLMVVEDALVINEGCAPDIVRTAITASKANADLATQIVQTASSVAPKQVVAIEKAASELVPGIAVATAANPAPQVTETLPVAFDSGKNPISGKNPGKQAIAPLAPEPAEPEDTFFVPSTIRGVFLIQPPASGPLPPPTRPTPVSPAVAGP